MGKIEIHNYRQPTNGMSNMSFAALNETQKIDSTLKHGLYNHICQDEQVMQMVQSGLHPGRSSFTFLPMIDLNPSNLSCVLSTLKFITEQARTITTLDQPLYWKAFVIISNEEPGSDLKSIILRLGGFHLEMSFLEAVGHLMNGTGLHQLLETVYSPNAVSHMITGKAVARALRGHMLVDLALRAFLVSDLFAVKLPTDKAENSDTEENPQVETMPASSEHYRDNLSQVAGLYDQLISRDVTVEDVCDSSVLTEALDLLAYFLKRYELMRTGSLLIRYSEMIQILRSFIKAERTGDWEMHLKCIRDILPYFAAAGHNLYTNSAYTYLTQMPNMETDHPDVHRQFLSEHHVLRRSDRFCAGLSCDLVIEQELMRSVKTSGGLTRDRGMGDSQRTQWLLSMPACADMNKALPILTGMGFHTSDQHKEATAARKERDQKDIKKIIAFLIDRNPFSGSASLRNIETGVVANTNVNQDRAKEVGECIIKSIEGEKGLGILL